MKSRDVIVASRSVAVLGVAAGLLCAFGVSSAEAARVPNKCVIAKNNEVAEVVGQVLKPATQNGPTADELHPGATLTSCIFEGDNGRVVVTLTDFSTPDEATVALDQSLQDVKDSSDITPTIVDETGLGDRAYWVKTETTSAYLVMVGDQLAAVAIAWSDYGMEESRPALLDLTRSVLEHI